MADSIGTVVEFPKRTKDTGPTPDPAREKHAAACRLLVQKILELSREGSPEALEKVRSLVSRTPEILRSLAQGAQDDCLERLIEYEIREEDGPEEIARGTSEKDTS